MIPDRLFAAVDPNVNESCVGDALREEEVFPVSLQDFINSGEDFFIGFEYLDDAVPGVRCCHVVIEVVNVEARVFELENKCVLGIVFVERSGTALNAVVPIFGEFENLASAAFGARVARFRFCAFREFDVQTVTSLAEVSHGVDKFQIVAVESEIGFLLLFHFILYFARFELADSFFTKIQRPILPSSSI